MDGKGGPGRSDALSVPSADMEGQPEFNAGAESASPGKMGDSRGGPAQGWIRAGSRT